MQDSAPSDGRRTPAQSTTIASEADRRPIMFVRHCRRPRREHRRARMVSTRAIGRQPDSVTGPKAAVADHPQSWLPGSHGAASAAGDHVRVGGGCAKRSVSALNRSVRGRSSSVAAAVRIRRISASMERPQGSRPDSEGDGPASPDAGRRVEVSPLSPPSLEVRRLLRRLLRRPHPALRVPGGRRGPVPGHYGHRRMKLYCGIRLTA